MIKVAVALASILDSVVVKMGRITAWLSLLMVVLMFFVVMLRHLFTFGSIALQESVMYLHAALFLCVSAYTLRNDGHVRVDVFYRNFSPRLKALVNLFGVVFFLFPVLGVIAWYSFDYVLFSWRIGEGSREAGGIPALYLMKSLILVFVVLFFIQGISEIVRNLLIVSRKDELLKVYGQGRGAH